MTSLDITITIALAQLRLLLLTRLLLVVEERQLLTHLLVVATPPKILSVAKLSLVAELPLLISVAMSLLPCVAASLLSLVAELSLLLLVAATLLLARLLLGRRRFL